MVKNQGNQRESERSALGTLLEQAAALRESQKGLEAAEAALERIPTIVRMAEKAKEANNEALEQSYQQDAQQIRDKLGDAKWTLDDARQALVRSLRLAAVRDEGAGRLLEQVQQLSPYPSVRVAREILDLIARLPNEDSSSEQTKSVPGWSKLHKLPDKRPSQEDRRRLAELLQEMIQSRHRTLASVWEDMGVAEGTLKRLRDAERVQPESWRKAVRFVREFHPDASE